MKRAKVYAGTQQKAVSKTCWIIDGNLDITRVRATYDMKAQAWSYLTLNGLGGSYLTPFNPTFGNGNRSFYGDGYHYATRRDARADQIELIKRQKQKLIAQSRKLLKEDLCELDSKLKEDK